MKLLFDRGTVVISKPPELLDVQSLPGVLWDPRTGQYRAPAWLLGQIERVLASRGVEVTHSAGVPPGLVRQWRRVQLREYQSAALLAWQAAGRRGVVVLPTGSGKTRVGMAVAAAVGGPALFMVPTRVLLHQWVKEIGGLYAGPVGCLGDGQSRVEAVTVSTFESAYRWMERIGDRFALLVADEVHHFGLGSRVETLEMSTAPCRLGLTATPNGEPENVALLQRLVGPVVFRLSVDDLAGRFLADYEIVTLELDLTADERERYEEETETFRAVHRTFRRLNPDADWAAFVRAASRSEQGRRALSAWRRARDLLGFTEAKAEQLGRLLERHRSARVLVFTPDNQTAYAVARRHLVMPITCDIKHAERERALGWFQQGRIRTLVSARVLNEGLDVPDADVAIIVGGLLGPREHVQRIGRLLRPRDGKRALVYELVCRNTGEVFQAQRRRRSFATQQSVTGSAARRPDGAALLE